MRDAPAIFLGALHAGKNACVRMDGCAALWRSLKRNSSRVRALAAFCSDGSAKFPVLPKEFDLSCDSSVCEMQIFLFRQEMWMGEGLTK
jgi:hypothetical protein